ncbi:hypothetical protein PINS_up012733 [Pythium insidiosum]|nr:hypothetical protein PINS_up012733 [Pythium insidiosum]
MEPISESGNLPNDGVQVGINAVDAAKKARKRVLWLKLNFTVKTARLQTLKRQKYQHLQEESLLRARGLLQNWENGVVLLTEDLYRRAAGERDAQELMNYTPEALALRFSLRNDPNVLEAVRRLWLVELPRTAMGCIDQRGYASVFRRIAKSLDAKTFRKRRLDKLLDEDWKRDSKGENEMSFANFFDSIFELADLWCDTIDANDYVAFLERLCDRISHVRNGKRVLKTMKNVTPYDADSDDEDSSESNSSEPENEGETSDDDVDRRAARRAAVTESQPIPAKLLTAKAIAPAVGAERLRKAASSVRPPMTRMKAPTPIRTPTTAAVKRAPLVMATTTSPATTASTTVEADTQSSPQRRASIIRNLEFNDDGSIRQSVRHDSHTLGSITEVTVSIPNVSHPLDENVTAGNGPERHRLSLAAAAAAALAGGRDRERQRSAGATRGFRPDRTTGSLSSAVATVGGGSGSGGVGDTHSSNSGSATFSRADPGAKEADDDMDVSSAHKDAFFPSERRRFTVSTAKRVLTLAGIAAPQQQSQQTPKLKRGESFGFGDLVAAALARRHRGGLIPEESDSESAEPLNGHEYEPAGSDAPEREQAVTSKMTSRNHHHQSIPEASQTQDEAQASEAAPVFEDTNSRWQQNQRARPRDGASAPSAMVRIKTQQLLSFDEDHSVAPTPSQGFAAVVKARAKMSAMKTPQKTRALSPLDRSATPGSNESIERPTTVATTMNNGVTVRYQTVTGPSSVVVSAPPASSTSSYTSYGVPPVPDFSASVVTTHYIVERPSAALPTALVRPTPVQAPPVAVATGVPVAPRRRLETRERKVPNQGSRDNSAGTGTRDRPVLVAQREPQPSQLLKTHVEGTKESSVVAAVGVVVRDDPPPKTTVPQIESASREDESIPIPRSTDPSSVTVEGSSLSLPARSEASVHERDRLESVVRVVPSTVGNESSDEENESDPMRIQSLHHNIKTATPSRMPARRATTTGATTTARQPQSRTVDAVATPWFTSEDAIQDEAQTMASYSHSLSARRSVVESDQPVRSRRRQQRRTIRLFSPSGGDDEIATEESSRDEQSTLSTNLSEHVGCSRSRDSAEAAKARTRSSSVASRASRCRHILFLPSSS